MKEAIKYSNNYVGIVDIPMRKAITQFANKNWQKALNLFHTDNDKSEANILASFGLLYSAAQLENEKATDYAEQLLNHTNFEFWPFLSEHNFPRYARRFALHFLAYMANENNNFERAIQVLNEALAIDSPIDDLDNIPLLETKIHIYLKQKETVLAFIAIQKILILSPENKTFSELMATEEYLNYLNDNNLEHLTKTQENESAKDALLRYKKFLKLFFAENASDSEYYEPSYFEKLNQKDLEVVETKFNFRFSPSYSDFVTTAGLFKIGKHTDYESCLLLPSQMIRLSTALQDQWNIDLKKELEAAAIEKLNNLICFSYGDESLQMVWYYCFDLTTINSETGEMSIVSFCQDDWHHLTQNGSQPEKCKSFDSHISKIINTKIEEVLY